MRDPSSVTLAVLTVSAAVLAALVAFTWSSPSAEADVSAKAGEYIMFTAAVTDSTDFLYIIDLTRQQMNAYRYRTQKDVIEFVDKVDLKAAFRAGAGN